MSAEHRFAFVARAEAAQAVAPACRVVGASRSGDAAWRQRQRGERARGASARASRASAPYTPRAMAPTAVPACTPRSGSRGCAAPASAWSA